MNNINWQQKHLHTFLTAATTAIFLISTQYVMAEELVIGNFSIEGLAGWQPKSFNGITEYRLIEENNTTVVKAISLGAASGLVKQVSVDPQKYRYLSWSWKILHTIPGGDETTKAGDDYAARIYVVFSGKYFWQTKAINYIWANYLNTGASIANAYTSSAIMVAVQSGANNAGQWQFEKRDIFADYKELFGSDPGEISAIAIMTDTDDTGENATAWYGDITLSTDP
jgi:hypothetical protein